MSKITVTVEVEGHSFTHRSASEIEIDCDDEAIAELSTREMAEACADMIRESMETESALPKVLS